MNRNQYCCQRCGNLKYDWSENLCPECLEKDRLRREFKKYFGMSIKMREATKEEKQGVGEYIQSISEKVYTKNEVIAMFEDLQSKIDEEATELCDNGWWLTYNNLIQQKIDKLKGEQDG